MMRLSKRRLGAVAMVAIMTLLFACGTPGADSSAPGGGNNGAGAPPSGANEPADGAANEPADGAADEPSGGEGEPSGAQAQTDKPAGEQGEPGDEQTDKPGEMSGSPAGGDALEVVADVDAVTVLVNKHYMLPEDFEPDDLVYPDVRFTFDEKIEKRMMRADAAAALEELFAAADGDGMPLAGVSAYRSHKRQKQLFESYVKRDGEEKARTYSAYPGTSEHETGLAIDVAGADGSCAATDCFADKPEATWLAGHAHEYGFIIRYPKGKEDITGYKYEPWHLRYVGKDVAAAIYEQGITLEEYVQAEEVAGRAGN